MDAPLRIFAISGSLRAHSSNLLVLETAALLAGPRATIDIFTSLGDVPLFRPDTSEMPAAVSALRLSIRAAEAVIFSVPEYAHGLPGALKNALDWLVGGMEITAKPVALFNASSRSVYAQSALREVLITMGAHFVDDACVTIPLLAEERAAQELAAETTIAMPLRTALARLAAQVQNTAPEAGTGQPVGPALPDWSARPQPQPRRLHGQYSAIEPLDAALHADALFEALCNPADAESWTYLPADPPRTLEEWRARLDQQAATRDPLFFTLFGESSTPAGLCAYLRIAQVHGSIEVGHIHLSPLLQHTRAATEIQYMLMRHVFDDLRYRRYEWKCDSLNAPSRRAALRLGFQFEGIFRNAIVYKQRSRDTAWFAVTDEEWPYLRRGFERWLAPENFDREGRQLQSLISLRQQP